MIRAWRITHARYAAQAFDGDGAYLYGGRWNSPGTRIVYVSGSQALAVLEMLVNGVQAYEMDRYARIPVDIPQKSVQLLDIKILPTHWADSPVPDETKTIGDQWAVAGSSVVLQVPSAVISDEPNYLINPLHPDYPKINLGPAQPFSFDRRLLKSG